MTSAKPVKVIRMGLIRVSIWANETASGTRFSVSPARLYNKGGEWKSSISFGEDEMLVLCTALELAHVWINDQKTVLANGGSPEGLPEVPLAAAAHSEDDE